MSPLVSGEWWSAPLTTHQNCVEVLRASPVAWLAHFRPAPPRPAAPRPGTAGVRPGLGRAPGLGLVPLVRRPGRPAALPPRRGAGALRPLPPRLAGQRPGPPPRLPGGAGRRGVRGGGRAHAALPGIAAPALG